MLDSSSVFLDKNEIADWLKTGRVVSELSKHRLKPPGKSAISQIKVIQKNNEYIIVDYNEEAATKTIHFDGHFTTKPANWMPGVKITVLESVFVSVRVIINTEKFLETIVKYFLEKDGAVAIPAPINTLYRKSISDIVKNVNGGYTSFYIFPDLKVYDTRTTKTDWFEQDFDYIVFAKNDSLAEVRLEMISRQRKTKFD